MFLAFSLFFHGFPCSPTLSVALSPGLAQMIQTKASFPLYTVVVHVVHWLSLSQILLLLVLLLLFLFLFLLLLLTCGMMVLKIKSGRGVEGNGTAPPPQAVVVVPCIVGFVLGRVGFAMLCCHRCLAGFLEVLHAICSIPEKRVLLISAPYRVFAVNDFYGLHGFFAFPLHCCSLFKLVVAVDCLLLFCMLSPTFATKSRQKTWKAGATKSRQAKKKDKQQKANKQKRYQ